MAKDPAFLFYPGDWLGGTMLLTRHQKGCYIDLLMAQFNSGPLSLDQIKTVLGQDQAIWTVLREKFVTDNNGRFFNEKMATEIEKRKGFVKSRSNNKAGRKKTHVESYDKSNDLKMKLHMENENENRNKTEKKEEGVGEGEQVEASGLWSTDIPEDIKLNEVQIGQTTMFIGLSCKVDLTEKEVEDYFEAFKIQNLGKKQWYNDTSDFFTHFRNSLKNDFKNGKANRTSVDANGSGKKGGTSTDRLEALKKWG